jgi:hypothetical protein
VGKPKKYWIGMAPKKCDGCHLEIPSTVGTIFYDAKHPMLGQWGFFCIYCFVRYNLSLGSGFGQQYTLEADGWVKTKG